MANELPEIIEFTGTGVTEGDFKLTIGKLRMYLDALLGSDGLSNTASVKLGAARNAVLTKTENYTATTADKGKVIRFTGDIELILSFSDAMSLGNGWGISVINDSTAALTIDPYSGELIDGVAMFSVKPAGRVEIVCDGSMFYTASKAIEEEEVVIPHGMQVFTESGTFTVPDGVTSVFVQLSGGGGGAAQYTSSGYANNGGASSFGAYLTATGGGGAKTANGVGGTPNGVGGYQLGSSTVCLPGMNYMAPWGSGKSIYYGMNGDNPIWASGSGGYAFGMISVTPGEVVQVTVGGGGSGTYATGNSGVCLITL